MLSSVPSSLTFIGYSINKSDISEDLLQEIRSKLLVSPIINPDYQFDEKPYPIFRQSEKKIYLPKFYGIDKLGVPVSSSMGDGEDISLPFRTALYPEQTIVVEKSHEAYKDKGGGIISLYCGGGKTTIALKLVADLGKKTLVVVHTEFLMDQWVERINQYLPEARVGIIRQDTFDVEDRDIVVGMIHSITKRDYSKDELKKFGHLIIDECHHVACKVFSSLFYKIQCKYMLGLSATPVRKDGLSKVIHWFIGPVIINIKRQSNKPMVRLIQSDCSKFSIRFNRAMKPNIPEMISEILQDDPRTELITTQTELCYTQNRKILILTERINHCNILHEHFQSKNLSCGKYIGGMKTAAREETCTKRIIIGTYKMASEGFDCPDLDTLILASPKSDIEQSVGRILRKQNNNPPLVIDIVDQYSIFRAQSYKRKQFYRKNDMHYESEDDPNEKLPTKQLNALFINEGT